MRSVRNRRSVFGVRRSEETRLRPLVAFVFPKPERRTPNAALHAFTLVEMLVAVALVMLIMTLFAQIFQMAGGSVSTQRGLMENDQRARSAQTLITGDLMKRTQRFPYPFDYNDDIDSAEANLAKRRGYFYISENDTFNDTDDVLALTVDARIVTESSDTLSYYGKSLQLGNAAFFRANANQPEADDGRLDPNTSADSQVAEIVYFLRNGNLYRRVLLIRQQSVDPLESGDQPQTASGVKLFTYSFSGSPPTPTAPPYPGSFGVNGATTFLQDFDYSAHPRVIPDPTSTPPTAFLYDGIEFNGLLSTLQISTTRPNMAGPGYQFPNEIAYPPNRFGHNTMNPWPLMTPSPPPPDIPIGGRPREYGTGGWWVGRLTMEETSNAAWTYPRLVHTAPTNLADPNNPMNTAVTWDDADAVPYVVDGLQGGSRRGEDLLLSNVHAFDVKVWDDVLGQFVDVGHSLPAVGGLIGDYHLNNRLNDYYGPNIGGPTNTTNRVFDTWYPSFHLGGGSAQLLDFDEDGIPDDEDTDDDGLLGPSDTDSDSNGTLLDHENGPPFLPKHYWADITTQAGSGRRILPGWAPDFQYAPGDKVFPPFEIPLSPPVLRQTYPFYYVCVQATDINMGDPPGTSSPAASPPTFGAARIDGLTLIDNELVWQAVDNRKPLRAVQITLRFVDPSTQQMRTMTIQHSLVK